MTAPTDNDLLGAEVRDAASEWREWAAQWRERLTSLAELPAGGTALLTSFIRERRQSRRFLRAQYGLDTVRWRWRRGWYVRPTPFTTSRYYLEVLYWAWLDSMVRAGQAVPAALGPWDRLQREATLLGTLAQQIEAFPDVFTTAMTGLPSEAHRLAATIQVAGLVGTRLSLGKAHRLTKSLAADGSDAHQALWAQLPSAVLLAWPEASAGDSLVTRVSRELSQPADAHDRMLPWSSVDLATLGSADPAVAAEDAFTVDDAGRWAQAAKLSPAETEVFLLAAHHSPGDIAAVLGKTPNDVRVLLSKARTKVRRLGRVAG